MTVVVMPSSGTRLRGIEGLRGIAAFFVLCFHVMLVLRASDQVHVATDVLSSLFAHGLTLFFVLSGFLLYRPYVHGILRGRPIPQPKEFLRNRVLRIWPAYVLILVVAGLVLGLARVTAHAAGSMESEAQALGRFTDPWMFLTNLLLVQGWFPDHMFTGLVVSWSLVTEVTFYLLLPVFGLVAVRLARSVPRIVAAVIPVVLLLLVGTAGRMTILGNVAQADPAQRADLISGPTWSAVIYRGILGQGDLFAVGMAAAVLVVAVSADAPRGVRAATWLVAVGATVGAVLAGGGEHATPWIGLFFAAGIALLQLPRPQLLPRTVVQVLETLPLRAAGLCSYSVYLWHCSVIWLLNLHVEAFRFSTASGFLGCVVVVAACTYLLSWPTYRWVELPFMERKHTPQAVEPEVEDAPDPDRSAEAAVVPITASSNRRRIAAAAAAAALVASGTSVAAAQNLLPAPLQEFAAATSEAVLPDRFALPRPDQATTGRAGTDPLGPEPAAASPDSPGTSVGPAASTTSPGDQADPSSPDERSGSGDGDGDGDGDEPSRTRPPAPGVNAPEVEVPDVDVPEVEIPELPDVKAPGVKAPGVGAPSVKAPDLSQRLVVPGVDVPEVPSVE